MNARDDFRNVLQGKNRARPPYVLFAFGLAARTANISLEKMVWDPAYYTSALESIDGLLGLNVIAANFDTTLESEALGAKVIYPDDYGAPSVEQQEKIADIQADDFMGCGRISIALETIKRLSLGSGKDRAIACAVTGPCSFTNNLQTKFKETSREDADSLIKSYGGLLTKLVRGFCEQKIDALLFREDPLGADYTKELFANQASYKNLYGTLFNIVKAFNAFPVIITRDMAIQNINEIHSLLKPSGMVLLGHTALKENELQTLNELTKRLKISFGLPLAFGNGDQEKLWAYLEFLQAFVSEYKPKALFYTSDGEIPYDIDMAFLLTLMDRLNEGNG